MVYALAEKLGWPESTLLWELPTWRVNAYYMCALRAAGVWIVSAGEVEEEPSAVPTLEELSDMTAREEEVEDLYDFL